MSEEQKRLDKAASWYLDQQLDFDRRMLRFRYESLRPYLRGPAGLELGSAEGEMTRLLLPHFETLTVVDAAGDLLERIPASPELRKVRSLFEDFAPAERFDTVVMEHVLEHVVDPIDLLRRARTWLADGGRILAGVPNAHSIHRLVAVKMGLLARPDELNARDLDLGHRRVYTPESLRQTAEAAGLHVLERGGVFFKPVSNRQIEEQWDEAMIEGFHLLGRDFPDQAAEIFIVCEPHA
jgi:2-polyprenyl-3-methyl-5-hydroxy-6-metoxy-1,4-benzoquinol methylase